MRSRIRKEWWGRAAGGGPFSEKHQVISVRYIITSEKGRFSAPFSHDRLSLYPSPGYTQRRPPIFIGPAGASIFTI